MSGHEVLVERMMRASRTAGEKRVAQLAYSMARTCLGMAEKGLTHFEWFVQPQAVTALSDELQEIRGRVDPAPPLDDLPKAAPSGESAAHAMETCLEVGRAIEGDSSRIAVMTARLARVSGDPEQCVDRLQSLLAKTISKRWYLLAHEALQASLLAVKDLDAVVRASESALAVDESRLASAFNLATAQAWLQDTTGFERVASKFREPASTRPGDLDFWRTLINDESPWFASRLNLEQEQVRELLLGEGQS